MMSSIIKENGVTFKELEKNDEVNELSVEMKKTAPKGK